MSLSSVTPSRLRESGAPSLRQRTLDREELSRWSKVLKNFTALSRQPSLAQMNSYARVKTRFSFDGRRYLLLLTALSSIAGLALVLCSRCRESSADDAVIATGLITCLLSCALCAVAYGAKRWAAVCSLGSLLVSSVALSFASSAGVALRAQFPILGGLHVGAEVLLLHLLSVALLLMLRLPIGLLLASGALAVSALASLLTNIADPSEALRNPSLLWRLLYIRPLEGVGLILLSGAIGTMGWQHYTVGRLTVRELSRGLSVISVCSVLLMTLLSTAAGLGPLIALLENRQRDLLETQQSVAVELTTKLITALEGIARSTREQPEKALDYSLPVGVVGMSVVRLQRDQVPAIISSIGEPLAARVARLSRQCRPRISVSQFQDNLLLASRVPGSELCIIRQVDWRRLLAKVSALAPGSIELPAKRGAHLRAGAGGVNVVSWRPQSSSPVVSTVLNILLTLGAVSCTAALVFTLFVRRVVVHVVALQQGLQRSARALEYELRARCRAEKIARENSGKLQSIVDHALDGIITFDQSGTILSSNGRFLSFVGRSQAEVIGAPVARFLPELAELAWGDRACLWSADPDMNLPRSVQELGVVRNDGAVLPVEFSVGVIEKESVVRYIALVHDLTERKKAELELKESLREKVVLLKELHHRVKNNLQVISSIFNLQYRRSSDPQVLEVLKDSQARIQSIALLHETLYRSKDLSQIDMGTYLREVVRSLLRSYQLEERVAFSVDCSGILLEIDNAIPCGLIVTELVTNSFKHAFRGGCSSSCVKVSMKRVGEYIEMTVSDNGKGIALPINYSSSRTLGLSLVRTLTRQIRAEMNVLAEGGSCFSFRFI